MTTKRKPTVVTIFSSKGGVGKTTLTANLGGLLAALGQRVLLVDADIQPGLSSYYPLDIKASAGLVELLTQSNFEHTISTTNAGCDLVYSNDASGHLQQWVREQVDGRFRVRMGVQGLLQRVGYDFVLIDTQGAVGSLQEAAVLAADMVLVPIEPTSLAVQEFARGTLRMIRGLEPMTRLLSMPRVPVVGVLYKVDRTRDARDIVDVVQEQAAGGGFGEGFRLLSALIPAAVVWRDAATAKVPVHTLRNKVAGSALKAMVTELFPHIAMIEEV